MYQAHRKTLGHHGFGLVCFAKDIQQSLEGTKLASTNHQDPWVLASKFSGSSKTDRTPWCTYWYLWHTPRLTQGVGSSVKLFERHARIWKFLISRPDSSNPFKVVWISIKKTFGLVEGPFCVCSSNLRGCTDLDKSRRADSLQTLSKLGRLQIWWNFSISIVRAEYTPEFCCPPDLDQALQKFMKTNDRQGCSCPQPIEALLKKFSLI